MSHVNVITRSVRIDGNEREESTQTAVGTLDMQGKLTRLVYKDDECTTTLTAMPGCIVISRMGTAKSTMSFREGLRTFCQYDTGFGVLDMEILTTASHVSFDGCNGKISLEYQLSVGGGEPSAHNVEITIEE